MEFSKKNSHFNSIEKANSISFKAPLHHKFNQNIQVEINNDELLYTHLYKNRNQSMTNGKQSPMMKNHYNIIRKKIFSLNKQKLLEKFDLLINNYRRMENNFQNISSFLNTNILTKQQNTQNNNFSNYRKRNIIPFKYFCLGIERKEGNKFTQRILQIHRKFSYNLKQNHHHFIQNSIRKRNYSNDFFNPINYIHNTPKINMKSTSNQEFDNLEKLRTLANIPNNSINLKFGKHLQVKKMIGIGTNNSSRVSHNNLIKKKKRLKAQQIHNITSKYISRLFFN